MSGISDGFKILSHFLKNSEMSGPQKTSAVASPQIKFFFAKLLQMWQFADLLFADHIFFFRFADPIIFCGLNTSAYTSCFFLQK
jgi:hypothetical protein